MRWSLTRASIALACLTFGLPSVAQPYEIVLGRPVAVGATYGIVASATNEEKVVITRGEQILQESGGSTRIDVSATATVLEIDEVSQPIRIRFVLDRCSIQRDGGSAEPFPAGTELVAAIENGSERFTVDGTPVADDVAAALTLIHSLTSSDETNDQVFGTEEKKKAGDTWPLDAKRSATGLAELGLPVAESSIHGETTLVEVTNDGNGEVLHIKGRIALDDLAMPELPGFRVDHASMTVQFSGSFPVDTTRRKLDERLEGVSRIEASEAGEGEGPKMLLIATAKRTSEASYTEPVRQ